MTLSRIAHYSVRTADLEASRRFYVDLLGLRVGYRPPFGFPGLWLYAGAGEGGPDLVHLIGTGASSDAARDAYLGARSEADGTGAFDHIAFIAEDWPAQRVRFMAIGQPYVEREAPETGQRQVFLRDPSGVVVELNYADS